MCKWSETTSSCKYWKFKCTITLFRTWSFKSQHGMYLRAQSHGRVFLKNEAHVDEQFRLEEWTGNNCARNHFSTVSYQFNCRFWLHHDHNNYWTFWYNGRYCKPQDVNQELINSDFILYYHIIIIFIIIFWLFSHIIPEPETTGTLFPEIAGKRLIKWVCT